MNRRIILVILLLCLALSGWFLSRAPVGTGADMADAADGAGGGDTRPTEAVGDAAGMEAGEVEGAAAAGAGPEGEAGRDESGSSDAAGSATVPSDEAPGAAQAPAEATGGARDDASGASEVGDEAIGRRTSGALTVAGFDYAAAVRMVEAAGLSSLRERAALAALEQARDEPDARAEALSRARRLLGTD